jgi:hypothetical protein
MTWGDSPTTAGLAGVGSTSPARGRPVADMLLCLLHLCLISGNFFHAAQRACDLLVLLGLERFFYLRAGALQASLFSSLAASLSSHHARHVQ